MSKENSFSSEDGLFTTETDVLNHSKEVLTRGDLEINELLNEYENLSNQYYRLLRQTKKLVSMADSAHEKLRTTNELVQEKVDQLTVAEEKLKKLTVTDPLTEINNRRGIFNFLDNQQIRYRRNKFPFSIFIIDVDHFKKVNDRYGHNAGDYVLRELANKLKTALREQDCIGRWGGEEFIVVLPETEEEGALILAEKIRKIIELQKIEYNDTIINVTISLGGCCYHNKSDLSHCLEMADKALYISKESGRNRVNFHGY